jgi:hypothetical protein
VRYSAKLRDETDLGVLNDDLVGLVGQTMQPAHVSLWLPTVPPPRARRTRACLQTSCMRLY